MAVNEHMKQLNRIFVIALFLWLVTTPVTGQNGYNEFYSESLSINNTGMVVLGSWAILNISTGAYGWIKNSGSNRYFHQMNLFWNVVNLSIAGFTLYSNITADYSTWEKSRILEKHLNTQNLFLINAGLDVAYMGGGFLLRHLSDKYPKNRFRLKGYGNSVILQGAFLFVFDLVLYGLQRGHRIHFLEQLSFTPISDALGIALHLKF
ncbi:MAG: hypothetical protein R6U78_16020 [Bacteroidales bacterium]